MVCKDQNTVEGLYRSMEVAIGTTVKRGGKYCVAGSSKKESCQNTSYTHGVSMHRFPKNKERRSKWVNFVRRHRPKFTPTPSSYLCSVHFKPTCFVRRQDIGVENVGLNKTLQADAIPTEDTVVVVTEDREPTSRERRQVKGPEFRPIFHSFNLS